MSATPTDKTATCRQNAARLACRLRSAGRDAGVEISPSYAARLVADGLSFCDQLSITRLGRGVVIHTAPDSDEHLPVVLGYVDANGEWVIDGSNHHAEDEKR
jgi:hypothetical protein